MTTETSGIENEPLDVLTKLFPGNEGEIFLTQCQHIKGVLSHHEKLTTKAHDVDVYVCALSILKRLFITISKSVKKRIVSTIITMMQSQLKPTTEAPHISGDMFQLLVIIISLLEIWILRNSDRLDLELSDFLVVLNEATTYILTPCSEQLEELSNMYKSAYCLLLLTLRQLSLWFMAQGFSQEIDISHTVFTFSVAKSQSQTIKVLLSLLRNQLIDSEIDVTKCLQHKERIMDVAFCSFVAINTDNPIVSPKKLTTEARTNSILELSESSRFPLKHKLPTSQAFGNVKKARRQSYDVHIEELLSSDPQVAFDCLERVMEVKRSLPISKEVNEGLALIGGSLSSSNQLLHTVRKDVDLYGRAYCHSLALWLYMTETKYLFKYVPQSYLHLAGFSHPDFKCMPISIFVDAVCIQSNFLVKYMNLCKNAILTSPHWFIQMLVSMVAALIDRGHQGKGGNLLSFNLLDRKLTLPAIDSLCLAAGEVGKASHLLFHLDHRQEVSRVARVPLDCLVTSLASMESPLYPALRRMLLQSCVFPCLQCIDKFALDQSKAALKPGPRELLRQVLSEFHQHHKFAGDV